METPDDSLSSILVDVDALAADQPALGHARELAIRCRARLKIVDVLPRVPSSARHFVTADYEQELVEHRTERLASVAARTVGADLTLLHAWSLFGGSVLRSRLPESEFLEYLERARRVAQEAMTAFTKPLADRVQGVSVRLVRGDPERAIPHFVDESGVDLSSWARSRDPDSQAS